MNFALYFVSVAALTSTASARVVGIPLLNITIPEGMEFLGARFDIARGGYNYFLISEDLVSWSQAQKVCRSEGLGIRLVTIESEEKDMDLIGFLSSKGHEAGWTAGNDIEKNGKYVWATPTGDQIMGPYFNWRDGVAQFDPDRACVSIASKKEEGCNDCAGAYKWEESYCGDKKKFICEL